MSGRSVQRKLDSPKTFEFGKINGKIHNYSHIDHPWWSYLQIVVKGRDLGAGVVVDVGDPGGVVQVSVEELQVLAQTVSRRHTPTQTVVTVLDGPTGRFTVNPNQKT